MLPVPRVKSLMDVVKYAAIAIAVVAVSVLLWYAFRGEDQNSTAVEMDTERIERELELARERSEANEAELFRLRGELEVIRNEIAESVRARDELHEALDDAVTIDDVNQLLRRRRRGRK
jgi:septal ring factor EnvC (AmiA/AmiB activator)